MVDKKAQGKKNRQAGARFELKVRKDLEADGWIVDKWSNNVELPTTIISADCKASVRIENEGRLIIAKRKYNPHKKVMAIGVGFPDFIAYQYSSMENVNPPTCTFHNLRGDIKVMPYPYVMIIGVEVKSNGYLDKVEKEKCKWLLDNNIFGKILIASKGKKRGEIVYKEFK